MDDCLAISSGDDAPPAKRPRKTASGGKDAPPAKRPRNTVSNHKTAKINPRTSSKALKNGKKKRKRKLDRFTNTADDALELDGSSSDEVEEVEVSDPTSKPSDEVKEVAPDTKSKPNDTVEEVEPSDAKRKPRGTKSKASDEVEEVEASDTKRKARGTKGNTSDEVEEVEASDTKRKPRGTKSKANDEVEEIDTSDPKSKPRDTKSQSSDEVEEVHVSDPKSKPRDTKSQSSDEVEEVRIVETQIKPKGPRSKPKTKKAHANVPQSLSSRASEPVTSPRPSVPLSLSQVRDGSRRKLETVTTKVDVQEFVKWATSAPVKVFSGALVEEVASKMQSRGDVQKYALWNVVHGLVSSGEPYLGHFQPRIVQLVKVHLTVDDLVGMNDEYMGIFNTWDDKSRKGSLFLEDIRHQLVSMMACRQMQVIPKKLITEWPSSSWMKEASAAVRPLATKWVPHAKAMVQGLVDGIDTASRTDKLAYWVMLDVLFEASTRYRRAAAPQLMELLQEHSVLNKKLFFDILQGWVNNDYFPEHGSRLREMVDRKGLPLGPNPSIRGTPERSLSSAESHGLAFPPPPPPPADASSNGGMSEVERLKEQLRVSQMQLELVQKNAQLERELRSATEKLGQVGGLHAATENGVARRWGGQGFDSLSSLGRTEGRGRGMGEGKGFGKGEFGKGEKWLGKGEKGGSKGEKGEKGAGKGKGADKERDKERRQEELKILVSKFGTPEQVEVVDMDWLTIKYEIQGIESRTGAKIRWLAGENIWIFGTAEHKEAAKDKLLELRSPLTKVELSHAELVHIEDAQTLAQLGNDTNLQISLREDGVLLPGTGRDLEDARNRIFDIVGRNRSYEVVIHGIPAGCEPQVVLDSITAAAVSCTQLELDGARDGLAATLKLKDAKQCLEALHRLDGLTILGRRTRVLPKQPEVKVHHRMPYAAPMLLVGEGNFSFAKSLCSRLPTAVGIVATTLDPLEELIKKYGQTVTANTTGCMMRGCVVHFGVNATTMAQDPVVNGVNYRYIVFNFPHTFHVQGGGFADDDDIQTSIEQNQFLVKAYFKQARQLLMKDGEVQITLKDEAHAIYRRWAVCVHALVRPCGLGSPSCLHVAWPRHHAPL